MTDREERQHVIEVLKQMRLDYEDFWEENDTEEIKAMNYAIASIETDLKYDLLYEETSGQADKSITKNNLAVDCRSLEDIKKLVERKADDLDGVMLDAGGVIIGLYFAIANDLPSVTQLSSGLEKNSKKLEKDFGESDCISREQALRELKESAEHHANDSREEVLLRRDRDIIRALPSVTPQEPKTGYCKDCKYFEYDTVAKVDGMRLILAHEICSRWGNGCKTKEDGYCFLFEPKESEG